MRRIAFVVVGLSLAWGLVSWPVAGSAETADREATATARATATAKVSVRLRAAIKALDVARETRVGYDRDKFTQWVDADGDCQYTRDEVLDAESLVPVSGCNIETGGRWYSYYDGETWTRASDVDIDHLVALAEAWDSGAKRWNRQTRERYANDLGDRRTLVAVTDNVNQSKGDSDVTDWLPDLQVCRYLREWTAVKTRWSLTVDRGERRTLLGLADRCDNRILHVDLATVHEH